MAEKFTKEQLVEYRRAFEIFDKDGNQKITTDELKTVLRYLGQNPTNKELNDIIRDVDKDRSGTIEWSEFLLLMDNHKVDDTSAEELKGAFEIFDKDKNGFIDANELRHVLSMMGETMSDKEVDSLLRDADIDNDGKINYREFAILMATK